MRGFQQRREDGVKKRANRNSSTEMIHSRCFSAPALSEITPSTGWKAIADKAKCRRRQCRYGFYSRPMMSDSQPAGTGKQGGHEEVEKKNSPKIQKLGCLVGTGCCVHYFYPQRRAGCPPVTPTRVQRQSEWRFPDPESAAQCSPASATQYRLTVCGVSIHAGSFAHGARP